MVRLWAGCFGLLMMLSMAPAPVEAQSGRSCRQVLPSDFRRIVNTRGQEVVYFRDPVRFLCTGDVLLESDSAVVNRSASTVELIGAVVYRDSTRELQADWANYLGRMDQLLARGSTVIRDLEGGAVVEGNELNYLRQTADRPTARMVVTGGRPHAILPPEPPRPAGDSLGARARADGSASVPTEVWANRLELEGEGLFRAEGNVDLVRGAMVGGGQTALFDRTAERMTLTRSAFVENVDYRLEGDRIIALLEGDGLREVRSEGSARVLSEELNLRAERVRIGFADGAIERLEAWNPGATDETPRARANARDFHLRADSLDVHADSVGVRELRAVGRAYGERGVLATEPAGRTPLPAALSSDWIQGDTILGFFARATPAGADRLRTEPDVEADVEADIEAEADAERVDGRPAPAAALDGSARGDSTEVVLERIEVVGGSGPALSLYRQATEEADGRPTINFMKASRIVLFMEQGDVARVEAEGPLEGVYLDPSGGAAGESGVAGGVGAQEVRR